ncbi:MAG: hypothetical protein ACREMX_05430, partial [Gemmatimonadales bacterium]
MMTLNRLAGWAAAVSALGLAVLLGCTDNVPTGEEIPTTPPPATLTPTPIPSLASASTGSCWDGGAATVKLTGAQSTYDRRSSGASSARIDASGASWTTGSSGAPVRIGGGSNICWHGGAATLTYPQSTSWSAYHDTYSFVGYGSNMTVEDWRGHNFGDGIKWEKDATDNWTVRRVHLSDMHDDCVETDWLKGGRIEDVLFEGCYVFLGIRARSSAPANGGSNTIVVDNAVVWMKPILNTYDNDPKNSTSAIFKIGSPSATPRLRLRNIVLRVDVPPGAGGEGRACLNPGNIVVESVNNVVVWTGSGNYPCLPLPAGWTLTRDVNVYHDAAADW